MVCPSAFEVACGGIFTLKLALGAASLVVLSLPAGFLLAARSTAGTELVFCGTEMERVALPELMAMSYLSKGEHRADMQGV